MLPKVPPKPDMTNRGVLVDRGSFLETAKNKTATRRRTKARGPLPLSVLGHNAAARTRHWQLQNSKFARMHLPCTLGWRCTAPQSISVGEIIACGSLPQRQCRRMTTSCWPRRCEVPHPFILRVREHLAPSAGSGTCLVRRDNPRQGSTMACARKPSRLRRRNRRKGIAASTCPHRRLVGRPLRARQGHLVQRGRLSQPQRGTSEAQTATCRHAS